MLAAGRERMARRAVESFRRQNHPNRSLLIFDTGDPRIQALTDLDHRIHHVRSARIESDTIGTLRNAALQVATQTPALAGFDLVAHWDSDDWSAPERIAEQAAFLRANQAVQVTGYRSMIFWRKLEAQQPGEAWMFVDTREHMALGTSLMYRRSMWEAHPFENVNVGEDSRWLYALRSVTRSTPCLKRMIATVHGGNTSNAYNRIGKEYATEWRRVATLDAWCHEQMEEKWEKGENERLVRSAFEEAA